MRYTLGQLRAYTAAAARDDRQRLAELALAVRIAFGADPAGWQHFQNLMTGPRSASSTQKAPKHG